MDDEPPSSYQRRKRRRARRRSVLDTVGDAGAGHDLATAARPLMSIWGAGPFAAGADRRERTLRRDAGLILGAALAAADAAMLVERALDDARGLRLGSARRVSILAVGKAAAAMAGAAARALGSRVTSGVVVVPDGWDGDPAMSAGPDPSLDPQPPGLSAPYAGAAAAWPPRLALRRAGHPLPDERSVAAAADVARAAAAAAVAPPATLVGTTPHAEGRTEPDGDVLLCLISGGGSALLAAPPAGVPLDALRETTVLLLRAGAPIEELNAVRKHLDALKGGGLARLAAPARVIGLVLSDVPGDSLDVIASGPLSPDPTTYADAIDVLRRRDLWSRVPEPVRAHLVRGQAGGLPETPKPGDPVFDRVELHVIGNAAAAAMAARAEAERLGYAASVSTSTLRGVARDVGARLARDARRVAGAAAPADGLPRMLRSDAGSVDRSTPIDSVELDQGAAAGSLLAAPVCTVEAGETTVVVRGQGRGGRCQELALAAALGIDGVGGVLVAAIGTDGIDGPTDAAGAVATGRTVARAHAAGLDPSARLDDNDAYEVFARLDDLVITGPTGTNVNDIVIVLVR